MAEQKRILLNMTGDEFKQLIEQYAPNGRVDTLPEILKAFQGMNDGETIQEYIERMLQNLPANSVHSSTIEDGGVHREDIDPEVVDEMIENNEVDFIGTQAAKDMVANAIGEER